jgi:hypothetical protein
MVCLSIGAFLQNLEYAASNLGYACQFTLLANTNQDENVVEVIVFPATNLIKYDIQNISQAGISFFYRHC